MLELLSLAIASFLAATVLPFSSEAVLLSLVYSNKYPLLVVIAIASLANTLGAIVNYCLGLQLSRWRSRRWFYFSDTDIERAGKLFNRYGLWSLAFAWLPIVGDALTLFAGAARAPFVLFLTWVALGKTARYFLVALVIA